MMEEANLPLDHYFGELLLFFCILGRFGKDIDPIILDSIDDLLSKTIW